MFHFDHRLRADSAKDGEYVGRLADRLRSPFHLRTAVDAPPKGGSVEAWATVARMNAANEVRKAIARTIAEGHTLDDQVETVLMNLIRGGGLEAVGGIWPGGRRHGAVSPSRSSTSTGPRSRPERSTSAATRPDEPGHAAPAQRDPPPGPPGDRAGHRPRGQRPIARSADLLREDRWELYASALDAFGQVVSGPPEDLRFDVAALLALPEPTASRVVRLALYRIMEREDVAPWTREAVDAIVDLARGPAGVCSPTDRRRGVSGSMFPSLALPREPGVKGARWKAGSHCPSSRTRFTLRPSMQTTRVNGTSNAS